MIDMLETVDDVGRNVTDETTTTEPDVPAEFRIVAGDLYARWTLDCVVDIAYHVSRDFVARPEFYKDDVTPEIVNLRLEWGTRADFPNTTQRAEMSNPIYGPSDGMAVSVDKFRSLRKPLLDAVTLFSEREIADPTAGIQEAVLSALALFTSYLRSFDGTSIRSSHAQIVKISDLAYAVLRSRGVAQVFGVTSEISNDWPLTSDDPNGALLIRSIGEKLQLAPGLIFTDEKFQRLRRVAQQGSRAIDAILDPGAGIGDGVQTLIASVYAWAVALRDYGIPS